MGGGGGNGLLGNLLFFAAGFTFALYNVLTKDTVTRYFAFIVVFWLSLFDAGGLALASLVEIPVWRLPRLQSLGAAAYPGLFCSVSAYLLYSFSLTYFLAGGAVNVLEVSLGMRGKG